MDGIDRVERVIDKFLINTGFGDPTSLCAVFRNLSG
jgi:hypothetical protein